MKLTLSDLIRERSSYLSHHRNVVTPSMEDFKANKREEIKMMSVKTGRSMGLFDLNLGEISDFFSVHNHRLENPVVVLSKENNIALVNEHADPATVQFNVETDVMFLRHLNDLSFDNRKNLVSLSLRSLKNKKGKYDVYFIRIYVIKCDDLGLPWLLLIEVELLETYSTKDFHPQRIFYVANENDPNLITMLESNNRHELTNMELKVLLLSSRDKKINEIAEELEKSVADIKAHRCNILRKLNSLALPQARHLGVKLKIILLNLYILIMNFDIL